MKRSVGFVLSLAIFFIFLLLIGSIELSKDAMIFPWIVGGTTLFLLGIEIHRETKKGGFRSVQEKAGPQGRTKGQLREIAWLVSIVPLTYLLGILLAIPIYIFSYLRSHREGWTVSLAMTFLTGLFFYLVFDRVLQIPFNEGLIISLFKD